mgnify:CR=1 FL=1
MIQNNNIKNMKVSKNILLLLIAFFATFTVKAQQDPQYTHYMYNTLSVNLAYAGQRETLSVVGLHRSQWVGIDGAPQTQSLGIHSVGGGNPSAVSQVQTPPASSQCLFLFPQPREHVPYQA